MDDVCLVQSYGLVQILPLSGLGESDNLLRLQRLPEGMISMTEEELEERITEQLDRERIKNAILAFEIESLKKAVEKVENISGI